MRSESSSWRPATLSDLVALQRGHDLPESQRRPGPVPVIGSHGISGWHDETRAKAPGVTIGRSGASMGVVTYADEDFWPLNTALFVTSFHGNDPYFAYQLLKTIDFGGFNSGSAQPSLNRNFVAQIPIVLPDVAEQRRIGAVLRVIQDKIESNRRVASTLEKTAAQIYAGRFSDFVGVAELDESSIGPVPRGWRVGNLGELACLTKRSVQPAETPDGVFEHFSIPAFDVGDGAEIVPGAAMLSNKTVLPESEVVLLSKLNPATKRVWWPRTSGAGMPVCSPEFLALVPRDGIPTTYLFGVLTADPRFYDELLSHATGTTGSRQRVKPSEAMSCRVLVPDAESLAEWNEIARPLYDHAEALRAENRTLSVLLNALAPKLVAGQIRVESAKAGEDPKVPQAA